MSTKLIYLINFKYKDLKVARVLAFRILSGIEFHKWAPEYAKDLRYSSHLGFGVYNCKSDDDRKFKL